MQDAVWATCLERFFSSSLSTHVEKVRAWCERNGCMLVEITAQSAPWLSQIFQPPTVLFVQGDPSLLQMESIAIVGTRRASPYGRRAARKLAQEVAGQGVTVVSGLALGIDTAAHQGALDAKGRTVAVLAGGLDRIYPPENAGLAAAIVEQKGALVSEYPPGVRPRKYHFPQRNRIIAGLGRGTVIVEAAPKSGSLITARFALEEGREVFAVPGPFDDESFRGNHEWIQQGAKLTLTVSDVAEELNWEVPGQKREQPPASPEGVAATVASLGGTVSVEELFAALREQGKPVWPQLEALLREGAIAPLGPQRYVWLKDSGAPTSSTCQTKLISEQ